MVVTNLQSPRSGRPVANQYVIYTDEAVYFQSYNSIIAKRTMTGEVSIAHDAWLSRTTKKYLKVFLYKEHLSAKEFNAFLLTLKTF